MSLASDIVNVASSAEQSPAPDKEAEQSLEPDKEDSNPHIFGSVYVNATGHPMFMSHKVTSFPVGSVIVREKLLTDLNSSMPELLAVMVKRGAGFNPAGGDWEYMVLNGVGTTVQERGRLGSCNSCHARQKETDFVFRTYLSEHFQLKPR